MADVSIRIAMRANLEVLIRVIYLDIGNFVALLFEPLVSAIYADHYLLVFGGEYAIYPLRRDLMQGETAVLPPRYE